MSLLSTPALVLRQSDRGDDDRLFTLLCPEAGRVQALARHARGSKRRFGGAVQPFVLFEAALRSRSVGLTFLEDARALEHPLGLEPDLEQLAAGWLFLDLAEQLCQQGAPQPAFFELVLGGLRRIGKQSENLAAVRLSVLWGALALEGWAPALDVCVRCGSAPPWSGLVLDPQAGGCLCQRCLSPLHGVPLDGSVVAQWKAAAEGRPIAQVSPGAEAALLRWAEHQTGRPFQSVRFDPSVLGA